MNDKACRRGWISGRFCLAAIGPNGQTVEPGVPVFLFNLRPGSEWTVAPNDGRFLINTLAKDAVTPPITVILNWAARKKCQE